MSSALRSVVVSLLLLLAALYRGNAHAQAALAEDAGAPAHTPQDGAALPEAPSAHEEPRTTSAELSDDAELQASLMEASLAAQEEPSYPRLALYGFADFSYSKYFLEERDLLSLYVAPKGSFAIGNLNLYVDSQMSARLRSLIEVRLSFLPNGAPSTTSNGQVVRTSTQVNDYRILGRNSQWGSIGIERAVVSYSVLPWLTLTAGRFITPWGLWNIDHGTPTLINIITPLAIDSQFIPTRQTGLQADGAWAFPAWRAGYYLTLSNGRGPVDTYRDFDENKAVGGRAYVAFSRFGELTLGMTFYFGRDTEIKEQVVRVPSDGGRAYIDTLHKASSRERALAADVKWEYKGYLLISEFVANGRTYDNDHRAKFDATQNALSGDGRSQFASDSLRYGGYVLFGHRFHWLGIMPFANFEYSSSSEQPINPKLWSSQLGLNIRPEPGLVLKLVGSMILFKDSDPRFVAADAKLFAINAQIAWAF